MADESKKDIPPVEEIDMIPVAELEVITLPELITLSSDPKIIEGTVLETTRSYMLNMSKDNSMPSNSDPSPDLDEEYP